MARPNCLHILANLPVLTHAAPKSAGFENAKLGQQAKMKILNFLEAKNCHRQFDHSGLKQRVGDTFCWHRTAIVI